MGTVFTAGAVVLACAAKVFAVALIAAVLSIAILRWYAGMRLAAMFDDISEFDS